MDAVKFVEEVRRRYKETGERPFLLHYLIPSSDIVKEVEEWSAAHPLKTRQSVFLEQYPDVKIGGDGVIAICPMAISAAYRDSEGLCGDPERECADCHREFWMKEVR